MRLRQTTMVLHIATDFIPPFLSCPDFQAAYRNALKVFQIIMRRCDMQRSGLPFAVFSDDSFRLRSNGVDAADMFVCTTARAFLQY